MPIINQAVPHVEKTSGFTISYAGWISELGQPQNLRNGLTAKINRKNIKEKKNVTR